MHRNGVYEPNFLEKETASLGRTELGARNFKEESKLELLQNKDFETQLEGKLNTVAQK